MPAAAEHHENRAPASGRGSFHDLLDSPPRRLGVEPMQIATCLRTNFTPAKRPQNQMGHAKARSGHTPILPIDDETLFRRGLPRRLGGSQARPLALSIQGVEYDSIRASPQRPDIRELALEQKPIFIAESWAWDSGR
jgi:hypothetical protein